jgi:hypothetical protein
MSIQPLGRPLLAEGGLVCVLEIRCCYWDGEPGLRCGPEMFPFQVWVMVANL